ncbi:hypothetical protein [Pedobacter psychrodurus]|uniref:hypothetical protein n=1 Tax=Pedobacter psychrodurus TaxID=2530456 RepID=UPI00292D1D64|nr:hypothetical protein [Pedobacter psychrodurus]
MLKLIKVKDNSNLGPLLYVFGLFPLFLVNLTFIFNLSYLQSTLITMFMLAVFLIFFFKNLIAKQEEYAIVADEIEITFLKLGTFKWNEIKMIKAVPDIPFRRNRYKFMNITLQNGKKFKIDTTNFDYPNHELETIFKALGKLTD